MSQTSLNLSSSGVFSPSTATRHDQAWWLLSRYNRQPLYSNQQLSTAILLSRVCFVCFLIHLSRALSSPLQLIVICLGPPNHLRHLLCRRCYDWIQALSCSLSMSLSRHIRYRTTMVDFRLFSDLVLQFLIPFNWAQNFYLQKCPLKLQNFQRCSLNLFLILFV